ncbi:nuclear transport factor 2 family protein [Rhodococcus sp. 06-1460-1B]|uniref:nuclear transport factor 2 family protein n=1 Tax=Rhodococcus sp. 06-1460-1B TaxID=2022501 RepID=UPI0020CD5471|nr:nuclear transport factor 2 family protein [Rhodococcus sp. 06-1460-1B]
MPENDEVGQVLELERQLQRAETRRDRGRLVALLADDFVEIGASGVVWTKQSTLELLGGESADDGIIEVHDFSGRILGAGVVLVQWTSRRSERRARRSSIWRRAPDGWELVHHQGTPVVDGPPDRTG